MIQLEVWEPRQEQADRGYRLTSIHAVTGRSQLHAYNSSLIHLNPISSFPSMPISQHALENILSLKRYQLTNYPPGSVH